MPSQRPSYGDAATLSGFWKTTIEPKLLERGFCTARVNKYQNVINKMIAFAGDVLLCEITADFVDRFREHLWETTKSKHWYRELWTITRKIVHAATARPVRHRSLRPVLAEPAEGTFRHYFENVYVPFQMLGRSAESIDAYRGSFYQLHYHFGRDVLLAELDNQLIAQHFQWRLEQGVSPMTVNRTRASLFAVWRYAHSLGACPTLPTVRKLPVELSAPDAWSTEQLKRIVASCHVLEHETTAGLPADKFWRAAILVCWYTAIRRRTLLEMRWQQIDLDEAVIITTPRTMKGKRGQKYRIGTDAVEALKEIIAPRRLLVFRLANAKLWTHTLSRQFNTILTKARVKGSISNTPHFHKLRRSVATAVADKKGIGAAAELLAHRSDTVTERYIDRTLLSGHDFRDVLKPLTR